MRRQVGFAVIYRWRLKPGLEEQFREGWERATRTLLATRGALGSRLHRARDGSWVAYAQWPSHETWQRSRALGPVDRVASEMMQQAEQESDDPILLEPVSDHLVCSTRNEAG